MTEFFENQNHPIEGYHPPVIAIEPGSLDFGTFNPTIPLLQQPYINLRIRNQGGSMLTGRIIPQVSWLIINPIQFKCKPGETSEHAIQISTGAPQNWNLKEHTFQQAVIISSNVGASALDIHYTLDLEKKSYSPSRVRVEPRYDSFLQKRILIPIAILLFLGLIVLGSLNIFNGKNANADANSRREQLYTQGAQTALAEYRSTAETPGPQQEAEMPLGQRPTATSLSLFAPLTTETPDLTATAFKPTFTPWPLDAFDHPELVVENYFKLLSDGNFQQSWNYLTRNYQEECCSALGTDPYYIYARDWEEVEEVKLITAFLQEFDLNPAPVQVRYQITMPDERPVEYTAMFWLVVDGGQTGLLIDEIDVLER